MVGRIGLHTVRASLPPALELGQLGAGQSMLLVQIDDADDHALDALHLAIAEAFVALGRVTFLEDVNRPTLGTLWRELWTRGTEATQPRGRPRKKAPGIAASPCAARSVRRAPSARRRWSWA